MSDQTTPIPEQQPTEIPQELKQVSEHAKVLKSALQELGNNSLLDGFDKLSNLASNLHEVLLKAKTKEVINLISNLERFNFEIENFEDGSSYFSIQGIFTLLSSLIGESDLEFSKWLGQARTILLGIDPSNEAEGTFIFGYKWVNEETPTHMESVDKPNMLRALSLLGFDLNSFNLEN